jgi:hypothetical protein
MTRDGSLGISGVGPRCGGEIGSDSGEGHAVSRRGIKW